MAGLTPQLTADQRTAWAERILAENNQTADMRTFILTANAANARRRREILGNNQDLICAYLILSMANMTNSTIVNPVTGNRIRLNLRVHTRLQNNCNLRAARRRTAQAPRTNEQREAQTEIEAILADIPIVPASAPAPAPAPAQARTSSRSSSSRRSSNRITSSSSSSPRNNTEEDELNMRIAQTIQQRQARANEQRQTQTEEEELNMRMTQAQRQQWARNILGDNINENVLRSNQENRTALVNEFMMSDARNVRDIIHGRLNIIQTIRNTLTQQQVCAYYILSDYTIDPRTGTIPRTQRDRARLLRECNLLPAAPAAATAPAPAPPAAGPAAGLSDRIRQLNPTHPREDLVRWARGVIGEIQIPGMSMTTGQFRETLERMNRYTGAQINESIRLSRERRAGLTPEQVCAYLILSNFSVNPRTGNQIGPGNTLNQLLNECNLRQRLPESRGFTTPLTIIQQIREAAAAPLPGDVNPINIHNANRNEPPNIINNRATSAPVAPPRPRAPSTATDPSRESEEFNAASILNQCNNTFGHIANTEGPFQTFGKKMLQICSKVTEPEISERDKPNAALPRINKVRARIIRNITPSLRQGQIRIANIDTKNILPFIYHAWTTSTSNATFFKCNLQGFYLLQNRFYGVGIDAGGVSKDLFSSLAEQIAQFTDAGFPNPECTNEDAQKLFVETSTGSGRYIFNHKFKLQEFKLNIPGVTPETIRTNPNIQILQAGDDYNIGYRQVNETLNTQFPNDDNLRTYSLCKFIGEFYGFCVINNIPISMNLSHDLLQFLHHSIDRSVVINAATGKKTLTYYLMDYSHENGFARSIISRDGYMMQPDLYLTEEGSEDIGMAGLYNDIHEQIFSDEPPFKIVPDAENVPVTRNNLINYLYRVALAHSLGITSGERDNYRKLKEYVTHFTSGFEGIRRSFSHAIKTKPILTLDLLLSSYTIPTKPGNTEVLEPYPANHEFTDEEKESMKYFIYKKIRYPTNPNISDSLKQILFNYGSDYPSDDPPELKEKLFIEFFKKLMKFWTGLPNVPSSVTHGRPLVIHTINAPGTQRRLPQSHTCFNTIDIPSNIQNKADLYNRLLLAVYEGNQGIALAGGKRSKK